MICVQKRVSYLEFTLDCSLSHIIRYSKALLNLRFVLKRASNPVSYISVRKSFKFVDLTSEILWCDPDLIVNPGNIVEVEIFDYSSASVRLCQGGKIFCILNRSLRLHIIVSWWKSLLTFALEYYRVLFSYFRFFLHFDRWFSKWRTNGWWKTVSKSGRLALVVSTRLLYLHNFRMELH